jgi:lipoprotein-anchoring transpeptidase ErfK/SrfK
MSDFPHRMARRTVLAGLGAALAGCMGSRDYSGLDLDMGTTGTIRPDVGGAIRPQIGIDKNITSPELMYAAVDEGPYHLKAIPYDKVPREFRRTIVPYRTSEAPGTIRVNLAERHLYFVMEGNEAIRYGVGIGKDGFRWSGRAKVQYKKEWPVWTPPPEMIERKPELAKYRKGQEPGPMNPLGARALYLFADGRDTGYRIHGSPEWWSIGSAMSSGCVRLINQDIIDLYNRVDARTTVVVA